MDTLRLGTFTSAGTFTVALDVNDGAGYQIVRDTLAISPSSPTPIMSKDTRRYGGSRVVNVMHDNGSFEAEWYLQGATPDASLALWDAFVAILESADGRKDYYLQWKPDGATHSVYYDVRGFQWDPMYRWIEFAGTRTLHVKVAIAVAPLALGDPIDFNFASITAPSIVSLIGIPGTAPAKADLQVASPLNSTAWSTGNRGKWPFGLLAWAPQGSPLDSPLNALSAGQGADTGTDGWTEVADANSVTGTVIQSVMTDTNPRKIYWTGINIDTFASDPFQREVLVEVWGRVRLTSDLVQPRITLQAMPDFYTVGTTSVIPRYTLEWGSAGRTLYTPVSGTAYRFVRLGTISFPLGTVPEPGITWTLTLTAAALGTTGTIAIDYLRLVPARSRVVSPTSKSNDSAYPVFLDDSDIQLRKTIHSDTSARLEDTSGSGASTAGLGGVPIELPPGNVSVLVKLSNSPYDVSGDTTTETKSRTIDFHARVWPRYHLSRGS